MDLWPSLLLIMRKRLGLAVIRLPEEKLRRTALVVQRWLHRRNATKREILSLVGVLQHAAKVVRPG